MIVLPDISVQITSDLVFQELWADFKIPKKSAERRWKEKISELVKTSKEWIEPAGTYDVFDCETRENQLVLGHGSCIFTSPSLVKAIGGSKKVGLFIATIGNALEKKAENCSNPDNIILEAIGSAATEACAEYLHRQIIEPLIKESGHQKTARLSPGWGSHKNKRNWDIAEQKIIFSILKPAAKRLNVELTANYLMIPRKSVSAIVGIKRNSDIVK